MRIKVLDQTFEVTEVSLLNDQIFETVNKAINSNAELTFSHLIIDGVEQYVEDFQQIETNNETQLIEVVLIEKAHLIKELSTSTNDYIANALVVIEELAMSFYKSPLPESWKQLTELFDAMDWLNKMLGNYALLSDKFKPEIKDNMDRLFFQMEELHKALTNKDYALIGDLLKYEVTDLLQCIQTVSNKIGDEVAANDKD